MEITHRPKKVAMNLRNFAKVWVKPSRGGITIKVCPQILIHGRIVYTILYRYITILRYAYCRYGIFFF